MKVDQQLQELRKDLAITVTEWKSLDDEKSLKDKIIAQLDLVRFSVVI
jgi:hypothetical protein